MSKNIILIIGQNKRNKYFEKSIKTYLSRNDITQIILVTYKTENIEFIKHNTSIKKILVPTKNYGKSEGWSAKYQKYLYDIGINYINDNYKEDNIFILKTRMDLAMSNEQLDYIFSQNYKVNLKRNTLFPYKIWIAWAHLTKPLYVEDACFYSHISVMKNLSPYTKNLFIHQGHTHIRWFFKLANEYNLYNDKNLYNDYQNMQSNFILNETTKGILLKYIQCIKNHFIIKTVEGCILFDPRGHNCINFYKKPSNNIIDIINKPHKCNLKIVFTDEDFSYII